MKTTISFLSLLFLIIGCHSCQLYDTPLPKTELEKLPPATQEGKGTCGCLMNGKAWFTKAWSDAAGDYQLGSLSFGGSVYQPSQSMGINLHDQLNLPELGVGTYDLVPNAPYDPSVSFYVTHSCYYGGWSSNPTIDGKLTITKFDKSNYIISGLFEFTLVLQGCDTLKITDGRFDMEYAP